MQYNKELLEKLKLQNIDLTKYQNLRIPKIRLGTIDNETMKTFLILSFMDKMSKQLSSQPFMMPQAPNYQYPYPYPQPVSQPQIIMMPSQNTGGGFSGTADEIKEFIYNQTADYRNAYEQNMQYISDEFEEIKRMINRR